MAAQPNIAGMARLIYVVAGAAAAGWGLWGSDEGWTQWTWLTLGGVALVLGIIGFSPLHAVLRGKNQKVS
jgi:protein-S-isoprenylcysteine O-methyltransferase Ste14